MTYEINCGFLPVCNPWSSIRTPFHEVRAFSDPIREASASLVVRASAIGKPIRPWGSRRLLVGQLVRETVLANEHVEH